MQKQKLYYASIRHTLQESVLFEKEFLASLGCKEKTKFLIHEEEIFKEWEQVDERIKSEIKKGDIDCSKLFIYQDGNHENSNADLSLAIKEKEPNQALLARLIALGAKLIVTEDEKLVAKQKEIFIDGEILHLAVKQVQESEDMDFQGTIIKRARNRQKAFKRKAMEISRKRDKYIVKQIEKTLVKNFTGLLFIGAKHKVVEKLDLSKFEIINLFEI